MGGKKGTLKQEYHGKEVKRENDKGKRKQELKRGLLFLDSCHIEDFSEVGVS